jgi:hypothetical protein
VTAVEAPTRRRLRGGRILSTGHVIYWWAEILAIACFYGVYTFIRNSNKSGSVVAYHHAVRLIRFEHTLGIYHEHTLQRWALHVKPLIIGANYFYGSLHFAVTIGAGVFLFVWWSDDYPRMRNALGIATAIALIGFISWPLMPPRLLPSHFGYVDTLARYPTFWSFNSGAMSRVSNQYAAMPSVHICWSTWCALAFVPRVRSMTWKVLAAAYPLMTLTVIVVTGNHYLLDAVGGLAILTIGYGLSSRFTRAGMVPVPAEQQPAAAPQGSRAMSASRTTRTMVSRSA